MQLSDEENGLAVTLKCALAQAEALDLGFVALSISAAIDHLEQSTSARVRLDPGNSTDAE